MDPKAKEEREEDYGLVYTRKNKEMGDKLMENNWEKVRRGLN